MTSNAKVGLTLQYSSNGNIDITSKYNAFTKLHYDVQTAFHQHRLWLFWRWINVASTSHWLWNRFNICIKTISRRQSDIGIRRWYQIFVFTGIRLYQRIDVISTLIWGIVSIGCNMITLDFYVDLVLIKLYCLDVET